jgi:hypothetical protein
VLTRAHGFHSATLREPEVIGQLPEGLRLNFYITGGSFEGPNCKGTLLPVGADWLTIRTDGIGILDVRATFKTDDGADEGRQVEAPP